MTAPAPVWASVVGQPEVVGTLDRAARAARGGRPDATGMTHAWLLTGPPGSGRSVAARAFAAALQCPASGCGSCDACHTVLAGTHGDVELVETAGLSISVDLARGLIGRAARHPMSGPWQVVLVEDADRLTDDAADALLRAIEEPAPHTVWLLCAPSAEDVLPTVRSRCRSLVLRTPTARDVARVLEKRHGVDAAMAAFAARASQGHIGRARRLATDEAVRLRRKQVLDLPQQLRTVGEALGVAADLVAAAGEESTSRAAALDAAETEELKRALGGGTPGRSLPAGVSGQLKALEKDQKARATRLKRDALDLALVDLAGFYRDVLAVQLGASVGLVNEEMGPAVRALASSSAPEDTLRRIEAVLGAREAVDASVHPLLAVEAMTLALRG